MCTSLLRICAYYADLLIMSLMGKETRLHLVGWKLFSMEDDFPWKIFSNGKYKCSLFFSLFVPRIAWIVGRIRMGEVGETYIGRKLNLPLNWKAPDGKLGLHLKGRRNWCGTHIKWISRIAPSYIWWRTNFQLSDSLMERGNVVINLFAHFLWGICLLYFKRKWT